MLKDGHTDIWKNRQRRDARLIAIFPEPFGPGIKISEISPMLHTGEFTDIFITFDEIIWYSPQKSKYPPFIWFSYEKYPGLQDLSGKCLTEENEVLSRWTEYYSELYNHESCGDNAVLDCSQPPNEELQPILREEVESAVASLKQGKSARVDRCFNRDLYQDLENRRTTYPTE